MLDPDGTQNAPPSAPPKFFPRRPLERDPAFVAKAERFIETGPDSPEIQEAMEHDWKVTQPDGHVVFSPPNPLLQIYIFVRTAITLSFLEVPVDYDAKRRRKFLKETFEERFEMSQAFRKVAERRALRVLEKELEAIWENSRYTLDEKKRIFSDLRDECLKGNEGAEEMRARLLAFVRQKMPPESPQAYTGEELRRRLTPTPPAAK